LIEKVRTVVTDGQGRYNIVDLRPGMYVVTFSLAGFRAIRREGIELAAGFTATVNVDMQVGALEETITVTGAAPLVDTQNVRQQTVVSDELLAALPTSTKALSNLINLIPAVVGQADVGGAAGIYRSNAPRTATFHGKGAARFSYDGMNAMNLGAAGATAYIINPATVEESTVDSGGLSAESIAGGVLMNMIPKEGGNAFTFSVSGMYTNDSLQSDNLTNALRARGLTTLNDVLQLYDANVTVGGPVKKDRLWFFTASRFAGNKNQVAGVFFNKTQGTPFYTPDLDRPSYREESLKGQAVRLTWQASPRNKVNVFADPQSLSVGGRGDFTAPEAALGWVFWPQGLYQISWSSPINSKLLLEAGASLMQTTYPNWQHPAVKPDDISIVEASTSFRYNASATYNTEYHHRYVQRFSMSYVTGSHAFKGGAQIEEGIYDIDRQVNGDVTYTFLRGVPNEVTQYATPHREKNRFMPDLGLYAQDQWTVKRLTLNYGLRFNYFKGYVAAEQVPATQFLPARDFAPVYGVPEWTDLNPRLGASYDLFGDGRTALKLSMGRYVGITGANIAAANNPITTSVNSVNRTWNDANGNYVPDCDFRNSAANGECGGFSNENFGKNNPAATRWADDVLRGFGVRDNFWDFSTEVQRQLGRAASVTGGYYRNWSDNFHFDVNRQGYVTDNLEVTSADYSPYCITAPLDPRLPGGGGYQVCGLYDIAPAKFGRVNNLVTQASNYGKQTRVSDFFGLTFNSRFGSDLRFGGGVDTGRTVTDSCFVVDSPQQLVHCRVVTPFKAQTQVKLHGSYALPGEFVVSGTFQNVPGPEIQATYPASNAEIAPSLGRNLAACRGAVACSATATVPLVAPQTLFEDRRTVLDLRLSRIFRMRSKGRLQANIDIYNVLNASSVLSVNSTFGPRWQFPVAVGGTDAILWGRMVQFGGHLSF
jgi:hypothetical protein